MRCQRGAGAGLGLWSQARLRQSDQARGVMAGAMGPGAAWWGGWGGEGCAVGAVQQVAVPKWSPNPSPHSLALPRLVGPGCVCQPCCGAQASDVLRLTAKAMRGQDGRFHVAACLCCLTQHRPVSCSNQKCSLSIPCVNIEDLLVELLLGSLRSYL